MLSQSTKNFKSFFEEKTQISWTKVNKLHQYVLQGDFHILNKKGNYKLKHLKLAPGLLIKVTKKEKQVDISNSRIEMVSTQTMGTGIKVTKNNFSIEFYGNVGLWFQVLSKWGIQTNFTQEYSVLKLIGKGNFAKVSPHYMSKVYKVRCKKDQKEYAVKAFDKTQFSNIAIDKPSLLKELDILRQMQHSGVISLSGVFESDQFIFVVQDLYNGGELYDYLKKVKPFTEEKAAKIIYNLLDAVQYIHSKGILHRDLKPENLILKEKGQVEDIVIADFGLADYFRPAGDYMFTRCGTPGYVAPELLQDKIYDYKVDVYSVGVLMYILLAGYSPFRGKNYDEIVMLNYKGTVDYTDLKLSKEGLECLQGMLDPNPQKRFSAQAAKAHIWFKKWNRKSDIILKQRMTINIDKQLIQSNDSTPTTSHSLTQFQDFNSPQSPFTNSLTSRGEDIMTPKTSQIFKTQKRPNMFFQQPTSSQIPQQLPKISTSFHRLQNLRSPIKSDTNTPLI